MLQARCELRGISHASHHSRETGHQSTVLVRSEQALGVVWRNTDRRRP